MRISDLCLAVKFIILEGSLKDCAIFEFENPLTTLLPLDVFALVCKECVVIMINASSMPQLGDWIDWALVFLSCK